MAVVVPLVKWVTRSQWLIWQVSWAPPLGAITWEGPGRASEYWRSGIIFLYIAPNIIAINARKNWTTGLFCDGEAYQALICVAGFSVGDLASHAASSSI